MLLVQPVWVSALDQEGFRMESGTEHIHRLLVLWLDLQRAVRNTGIPEAQLRPWDCADPEVTRVWEQITQPQNRRALEEWLFQIAPGTLELWAREALQQSRHRPEPPPNPAPPL